MLIFLAIIDRRNRKSRNKKRKKIFFLLCFFLLRPSIVADAAACRRAAEACRNRRRTSQNRAATQALLYVFFNFLTFLNICVALQFLSVFSFSVVQYQECFCIFILLLVNMYTIGKEQMPFTLSLLGFKNEIDSFSTCQKKASCQIFLAFNFFIF